MKTLLSFLLVVVGGVFGFALVFSRYVPPGLPQLVVGALVYALLGFALARVHAGARPWGWSLATPWTLVLLGAVGVWITLTDPASGDLGFALLFLLGAPAAVVAGMLIGSKRRV